MFSTLPPFWSRTYMRPTKESEYPGIFLYMKERTTWTTHDAITNLINVCTPNKALRQQTNETIDQFVKEIKQKSTREDVVIRASLDWMMAIEGQLVLMLKENVVKPQATYAIIFEITPEGNFHRIVRSFTLTDSPYKKKVAK